MAHVLAKEVTITVFSFLQKIFLLMRIMILLDGYLNIQQLCHNVSVAPVVKVWFCIDHSDAWKSHFHPCLKLVHQDFNIPCMLFKY